MSFSRFIAGRMGSVQARPFTRVIIRFAIAGIGISLAVMLLAIGIILGFKHEIREKLAGIGGHITVQNLDLNYSREAILIPKDTILEKKISSIPGVQHIQPFCGKAGIVQHNGQIEGLYIKGVPTESGSDLFRNSVIKGRFLRNEKSSQPEIMVSKPTAERMNLDTGESINIYFVKEGQVRLRRVLVCGIFNTGLAEFDSKLALGEISMLQRVQTSGFDSISGYEVYLAGYDHIENITQDINRVSGLDLKAKNVLSQYGMIFDWLEIIDTNAVVIIILMIFVALINMCTALLILIVERTRMIGVLKSIGATNAQVRNIFMIKGLRLVGLGLLIGNVMGLVLGFVLRHYKIVKLDQEIYYMDAVPFEFNVTAALLLNAGTLLVCFAVMFIPVILVKNVNPVKALRFS